MPRKKATGADDRPLPTIWRVPDAVWERAAVLIGKYDPPKRTGRKRSDERAALDGLIHVGRTGCQWNELPKAFGDDSSVHRAMQRWVACDLLGHLWGLLLSECDELNDVDWKWQSADGVTGTAGTTWGRTQRTGGEKRDQAERPGRGGRRPPGGRRGRGERARLPVA